MSDDLERFDPFAEQTPRGYRGTMRRRDTGKWVRLDDVALLRMQAHLARRELSKARATLALYEGGLTDAECRAFAHGYDREDSAQMGEPDPWTDDPGADEDWKRSRVACVRAGLDALARMGQEWDDG